MFLFNLHPATVHFPIALLMIASISGLLYLFWHPKLELRDSTWWTMAVGWLGALLATLTGLLDQASLPPRPPYQATLDWHITTGLASVFIYGTLLYQRWVYKPKAENTSITDFLDEPSARLWIAALLIIGVFLVFLSSWHGGQLVYRWGVNVGQ